MELGGTDQKFNLLVGRELQKEYGQEPQVLVMMPLLEGTDGVNKMSKSLGNYIGINEGPGDIFGKTMSISDELMFKYYELLSERSTADIYKMREDISTGTLHPMAAKKSLAEELVARYHGLESAKKARADFEKQFSKGEVPDDIPEVMIIWEPKMSSNKPVSINDSQVNAWMSQGANNMPLAKVMVLAGLVSSVSEGKRLIKQGGVELDGARQTDPEVRIKPGKYLIKSGKRRFVRVSPNAG